MIAPYITPGSFEYMTTPKVIPRFLAAGYSQSCDSFNAFYGKSDRASSLFFLLPAYNLSSSLYSLSHGAMNEVSHW